MYASLVDIHTTEMTPSKTTSYILLIPSVTSNTYKLPPRSVLKGDHVEFLGRFPIHAVVFDPTGTKWSGPCNRKENFSFFLINKQICKVSNTLLKRKHP